MDVGGELVSAKELASVLGYPVRRIRRWLEQVGIAIKHGRVIKATVSSLRRSMPHLWGRYLAIKTGNTERATWPLYVKTSFVEKAVGSDWWWTKRWLSREGALIHEPGYAVTTPEQILQSFPDVAPNLLAYFEEN